MKNLINSIYQQVRLEMDPINLEGNTCIWDFKEIGESYPNAIVAGCERDIGITIQSPSGMKLTCLNRKEYREHNILGKYNKKFDHIVAAIRTGYFSVDEKKRLYNDNNDGVMSSCAFIGS